jgi:long-subunit fatty acid transport protein
MRTIIAVFVILMIAPVAARAAGYAIPNEHARELALSQATVAAQNGPEAVYQNVAALAGQQGLAFSGSVEMLINDTNWSDPALGNASLRPHANFPPAAAIAWGNVMPNGVPFGVGFGFNVPGGGSLPWPTDWQGAPRIQFVQQRVYLLQLGGGVEPIKGVKIGASIINYRATEKLDQQINYLDHQALATLGLSGNALSFGLAGEFRLPWIPLTIGVDYRHKGDLRLTGNAHFENVPPSLATVLQDQAARERLIAPNEFFAGLAYDVLPNLKAMFAYSLERWIVYTDDTYYGDKGLVLSVPRNYRNGYVFRLGAEYTKVPGVENLTLRLGGLRSISPQRTDFISPTLTDGNSWAISGGLGYQVIPSLRIDVGYQHAFFDTVTATGVEAFPGSYDTTANLVAVGLTFRLDI